jgi:hypothetical protein
MFFLLRMVFWIGLVLVLLPRDKTPDSDKLPKVGSVRSRIRRDRRSLGHESVLQAPAGGM